MIVLVKRPKQNICKCNVYLRCWLMFSVTLAIIIVKLNTEKNGFDEYNLIEIYRAMYIYMYMFYLCPRIKLSLFSKTNF